MVPALKPRAVIYMRGGPGLRKTAAACLRHAEARGYRVVAIEVDHSGTRWIDVVTMVVSGSAEVIVVPCREDLAPDRIPRVEVVTETAPPAGLTPPRQRRPRRRPRLG